MRQQGKTCRLFGGDACVVSPYRCSLAGSKTSRADKSLDCRLLFSYLRRANFFTTFIYIPASTYPCCKSLVLFLVMDPASLSLGVVSLFLTCCKGYKFLSDTKNAPSDAQDAARRVHMEFCVLGSWGMHFELRSDLPEQQNPEKLRFFLTNEHARRGVFDALCSISETFTDVKRLEKKYGIVCEYHTKGDKVSFSSFTRPTHRLLIHGHDNRSYATANTI